MSHIQQHRTWTLRDEFYRVFHQWPLIFLFSALGCLAGWVAAQLWPAYYKATVQVHVALNPYRTYSDATFLALARPSYSNLDDFKNWQMSQLESVIYTDAIINDTAVILSQDHAPIDEQALLEMLGAEWRSAGVWSLTASSPDHQLATLAAQTWGQVAVKHVEAAVAAAQETFMIDQQLAAAAQTYRQARQRQTALQVARQNLLTWNEQNASTASTTPLPQAQRWDLISQAASLARFNPAWQDLLATQPGPDAAAADYLVWNTQVIGLIDAELDQGRQQLRDLEKTQDDLAVQYAAASSRSLGLSPNLEIESISRPSSEQIHPTSVLILLGGVTGLLAWLFTQVAVISRPLKAQRSQI